nr:PREDICTED: T-cell activation Rho GTPase-activating protein-like [Apteryx mantelli mantelli]
MPQTSPHVKHPVAISVPCVLPLSDRKQSLEADGTKKRKRLIPSWRRTSANRDCPGQPGSGLKSPLFGQPLATLCGEEETLPQPVQDLLAILYREGPVTEGIFRKAANEKARRDLKEALNKGGTVDLDSKPVHLLAVVLKVNSSALQLERTLQTCRGPLECLDADGTKKRKRLIPSWRRTSANRDCPGQPGSGLKSPLFGQPLATLCGEEETLPQPVQDLLAILYREGPVTEGIFRKAANEKARRDLKEALNKGGTVDLDSKPVHLLAVVLKDFLHNIPPQLLSSALYEKWMLALEEPSREEKIEELKEVADQLPRPNVLLLKSLLAVLHRISQNAETNRMDSSNLAICVGPNMLSPGTDSTLPLEVQKEMNDKIC